MADELEALRAQRLAELQAGNNTMSGGGRSMQEKAAAAAEEERASNEMKNSILSQVLTQGARARLNTLMIGKPEKGRLVENMILRMAQNQQIMSKLSEEELISILERVNQQSDTHRKTTVKFDRRRAAVDSDDEL